MAFNPVFVPKTTPFNTKLEYFVIFYDKQKHLLLVGRKIDVVLHRNK